MATNDNISWLIDGPVDYELKKYKMLAILSRMRADLKHNLVWSVIQDVENQLDLLYHTKYEIEVKEEKSRIAKDIDFFNFEIIYETANNVTITNDSIIDNIISDAILEFGEVYMEARELWRSIEKNITLTWIPKKQTHLNKGYIIIPFEDGICYAYEFGLLSKSANSWRDVKLSLVETFNYSSDNLINFCNDFQNKENTLMFARMRMQIKGIPLDEAIVPISKQILFSNLAHGFA
jgi:hypothetical protein